MSLSSASSSISSLVMQLQHIESTIAGILLEVVLKLSSLTDSDIFLIVEDAGRRSWMGRRRFREGFLDGSLAATPADIEWTLENGDRIVRRQGGERGADDGDDLDGAMASFISPSKKPEVSSASDDHPDSSPSSSSSPASAARISNLVLPSPPSSPSLRRKRLTLVTSATPPKRLCLRSPLARPERDSNTKVSRPLEMETVVAVKDEPVSDSESVSRRHQHKRKQSQDGATDDDAASTAGTPDDDNDADYDPGEKTVIDVGTHSFRRFRKSRRLRKKACCVTPVKKTRSSKNGNANNSLDSKHRRDNDDRKKATCRPLRILLRRSKGLGKKATGKKADVEDGKESEEEEEEPEEIHDGGDVSKKTGKDADGGGERGTVEELQTLPSKRRSSDKTSPRKEGVDANCKEPTSTATGLRETRGCRETTSRGKPTSTERCSPPDIQSATIVDIQSVRIIEQDGTEGSPIKNSFDQSVVRNLSNDMSSCESPLTVSPSATPDPPAPPPPPSTGPEDDVIASNGDEVASRANVVTSGPGEAPSGGVRNANQGCLVSTSLLRIPAPQLSLAHQNSPLTANSFQIQRFQRPSIAVSVADSRSPASHVNSISIPLAQPISLPLHSLNSLSSLLTSAGIRHTLPAPVSASRTASSSTFVHTSFSSTSSTSSSHPPAASASIHASLPSSSPHPSTASVADVASNPPRDSTAANPPHSTSTPLTYSRDHLSHSFAPSTPSHSSPNVAAPVDFPLPPSCATPAVYSSNAPSVAIPLPPPPPPPPPRPASSCPPSASSLSWRQSQVQSSCLIQVPSADSTEHTIFPVDASLFTGCDPFMGEAVLPLGSPVDGVTTSPGAYEVVSTPSSSSAASFPTISPSTLSSSTNVSPGSSITSVFPSIPTSLSPVTPPGRGAEVVGRGRGGRGAKSSSKIPRGRGRNSSSSTPSRTSLTPSYPRVSGGKPLSFLKSVSSKSMAEKREASKAKRIKAKESAAAKVKAAAVTNATQRRTYSKKTAVVGDQIEEEKTEEMKNPDGAKRSKAQVELETAVNTVLLGSELETDPPHVAESTGAASSVAAASSADVAIASSAGVAAASSAGVATTSTAATTSESDDAIPVVAIIEDDSPRLSDSEINCERVTLANNIDEFDADNPSFAKRPGVAKVVHLGSGKNVVKSQAEQERNKPNIEHNAVMGYDTCEWKGFNYYHQKNNSVKTPYVHFKCQIPGCLGRLTLHRDAGNILTTTKHSANQCKFQSSFK